MVIITVYINNRVSVSTKTCYFAFSMCIIFVSQKYNRYRNNITRHGLIYIINRHLSLLIQLLLCNGITHLQILINENIIDLIIILLFTFIF